jgi:uncharacterized protein (DUF433 family)
MIDYTRRFTRDPRVCGGQTVVAATRVPLLKILASLADGAGVEEILVDLPTLGEEDVRAVVGQGTAQHPPVGNRGVQFAPWPRSRATPRTPARSDS